MLTFLIKRAANLSSIFSSTVSISKLFLSLAIFTCTFSSAATADPGSLDVTFGNGGLVISPYHSFNNIAKQADGKIIAVGYIPDHPSNDFVLVRFNTDGSLDNTFNNTGIVYTDFSTDDHGSAIAIQKDGKIIAAGFTYNAANSFYGMAVARYNQDGSLDNTFDGDGKVLLSKLSLLDEGNSLAIQEDAKILVAGSNGIVRLNSNGSIDSSFAGGQFTSDKIHVLAMAVHPGGKILLAGYSGHDFGVLRLNTNGSPDNTFNGNGYVSTDFGGHDVAYCLTIQDDGRIVVGGETRPDSSSTHVQFALARYNPNGSLDATFDGDGKVTTDFGVQYSNGAGFHGFAYYYGMGLQTDGKIVMTGGGSGILIARYNIDGSLDNSFDGDGKVIDPKRVNEYACVISNNTLYITGATGSYDGFVAAYSLDSSASSGLSYKYYEGNWDKLPDFSSLAPVSSGFTTSLNIGIRPSARNDNFAFLWEGYINITTPGNYTFETLSDDGSKFYFNNFYSPGATALVNNDGVHAPVSATGTINIPTAGLYPVAITYFEKDGGEAMQLYWTGPGITRQLVPAAVFTRKGFDDITPPTPPTNLQVVYRGRTFVRLDWDNATDNTSVTAYEIYVYINGLGHLILTTTQSIATIENLLPNTAYGFIVYALDAAGNRSYGSNSATLTTISNGLSYKFYNNIPFGQAGLETVTPTQTGSSGNIDISVRPQGINQNYAFIWQGYINIPAAGTYTFETISDDGSKMYFNTPYSDIAEPLVNNFDNNGLHAPVSVSNTITIPSAGLYPVAIRYHQYGGGQLMQFYWQGPGFARQLVPDAAFTDDAKPGFLTNGLNYKYYEGSWTTLPDFSTLTPVKTGISATTDITVRAAGRNDNFAFLWEGYITVPTAGDYTFETVSDDGSKLYFNSLYIPTAAATVNNDGLHPATAVKATVHIGAAGTYPISISFFENTGDQAMEVYWTGPGITRQLIPTDVLSPNPSMQINRLSYRYYQDYLAPWTSLPDFNALGPDKTGNTPNTDISVRFPERNDLFGFVWQGYINIPVPGIYTFETVSDDGSKLYFNNFYSPALAATVNNDGLHASKSVTGTVNITNAGVYPIAITFFEQFGGESMEVYWSAPGMARQRIPNEAFTLVSTNAVPALPLVFGTIIQKANVVVPFAAAPETVVLNSVYPNPFDQSFVIDFNNSLATNDISIGIFDLNGRRVYTSHQGKMPVGNNIIKMNVGGINIKDGVYIMQLWNNGMVLKTVKLVKMKK